MNQSWIFRGLIMVEKQIDPIHLQFTTLYYSVLDEDEKTLNRFKFEEAVYAKVVVLDAYAHLPIDFWYSVRAYPFGEQKSYSYSLTVVPRLHNAAAADYQPNAQQRKNLTSAQDISSGPVAFWLNSGSFQKTAQYDEPVSVSWDEEYDSELYARAIRSAAQETGERQSKSSSVLYALDVQRESFLGLGKKKSYGFEAEFYFGPRGSALEQALANPLAFRGKGQLVSVQNEVEKGVLKVTYSFRGPRFQIQRVVALFLADCPLTPSQKA